MNYCQKLLASKRLFTNSASLYKCARVTNPGVKEAEAVMQEVFAENPSHWPNGVSVDHFDGGVYLIKECSTDEPVGFTGWQVRRDGNKSVGYYSIGIKKAHRRKGFAKEAVQKLVDMKRPFVDECRALIVQGNNPSLSLAKGLQGVNYQVV
jgi:ribosomal protein S18 acetylase RimI-like enzyme